jgi:hypothetical protein
MRRARQGKKKGRIETLQLMSLFFGFVLGVDDNQDEQMGLYVLCVQRLGVSAGNYKAKM